MSTNPHTAHHPGCSGELVQRALRKHGKELYRLLSAWLADHPDNPDPVAFIQLDGDGAGLSKKIRARKDALATLRGEHFDPDLIRSLVESPPVRRGSVDLIVLDPVAPGVGWFALERVTPRAKGSS